MAITDNCDLTERSGKVWDAIEAALKVIGGPSTEEMMAMIAAFAAPHGPTN